MIHSILPMGFTYHFRHMRDGRVLDEWTVKNLMPYEGVNHMLDVLAALSAPVTSWHIGLYGNDHTPQTADVAATFPAVAGEVITYDGNRPTFAPSPATSGVLSNAGNEAEFTINAATTVRGGFIASNPSKASPLGVLLSAVRMPSPRSFEAGDVVSVAAGLEIIPS